MRVLLDVDDVIADFTGMYLRVAAEENNSPPYNVEDLTEWSLSKCLKLSPEVVERIENRIREERAALYLPELPGSVEAVKHLAEIADVYFVTSPLSYCPTWTYDRTEWLVKRFGKLGEKVIHTSHKEVVVGDLLLDDKPANIIAWANAGHGIPVLWDHPVNRSLKSRAPIVRAKSWNDVFKLVDGILQTEYMEAGGI